MTAMYDDPRRAFLDLVPEGHRSQALNLLLARARDGAGTAQAIYDGALANVRGRLGGWGAEDPALRAILGLLLRHRTEALDLCAWCLDWERLSPAEKARQKAARGEEHRRAHLDEQPPTTKQLDYLRSLGYRGTPRSKAHASELIDGLVKARVA